MDIQFMNQDKLPAEFQQSVFDQEESATFFVEYPTLASFCEDMCQKLLKNIINCILTLFDTYFTAHVES